MLQSAIVLSSVGAIGSSTDSGSSGGSSEEAAGPQFLVALVAGMMAFCIPITINKLPVALNFIPGREPIRILIMKQKA